MVIALRDYLSTLGERDALDKLLPDLLSAMGYVPFSVPQTGARQFGVDVAAVTRGTKQHVFLFVVKPGDMGRVAWDGSPQAVRPTLNEVIDTYIPQCIPIKYKEAPVSLVLVVGGVIKQETQPNWAGFVSTNRSLKLEIEAWDGNTLARRLSEHMLNEYVLVDDARRALLRKALALTGEVDYDLRHYFKLLDLTLNKRPAKAGLIRAVLSSLHLCLRLIIHWARAEENLKHAYLASERTVITLWGFIQKNALHRSFIARKELWRAINVYIDVNCDYFLKIRHELSDMGSLTRILVDPALIGLSVFEQIGILSTIGLHQLHLYFATQRKEFFENAFELGRAISEFVGSTGAAHSPLLDGNSTELSLAFLLLYHTGHVEELRNWIRSLMGRIAFAYKRGQYFPIDTDDPDDLWKLNTLGDIDKKDLSQISTIIPVLAEWAVVLDDQILYSTIVSTAQEHFKDTTLQMWFPDDQIDEYLWTTNPARTTGYSLAPLKLPESLADAKTRMRQLACNYNTYGSISSVKHGIAGLEILSYRHFHTPIPPFYWQGLV